MDFQFFSGYLVLSLYNTTLLFTILIIQHIDKLDKLDNFYGEHLISWIF